MFSITFVKKVRCFKLWNLQISFCFLSIVISQNPGLDILIPTNKYTKEEFYKLIFLKVFGYLLSLIAIYLTILFKHTLFFFNFYTSIIAMSFGGIIGNIPACLRNFLYANGFSEKCASSEYARIGFYYQYA